MKGYYEKYWQGSLEKGDALYADPPDWPEKETRRILAAMGDRISGRVLDVGCGDGTFARLLRRHNPDVDLFCLDLAEAAVAKAGDNHGGPPLRLMVGSVESLPCGSDVFDGVLLIEVLEHVFDIGDILREIHRVLKKDGVAFITTTDFNWPKKLIIAALMFDRYFYPTNPHIRFFTRKTLADMLQKTGFKVASYQWNGSYLGIMPMGQIVIAQKVE